MEHSSNSNPNAGWPPGLSWFECVPWMLCAAADKPKNAAPSRDIVTNGKTIRTILPSAPFNEELMATFCRETNAARTAG
jgi:hypothetical protein